MENIDLGGASPNELQQLLLQLKNWSKALNNQVDEEKIERELLEIEVLLEKEHIDRIRSSEDYRAANDLFFKTGPFSFYQYTLTRDFLIFEMEMVCHQRSGVFSNLLLSEVSGAKKRDNDLLI